MLDHYQFWKKFSLLGLLLVAFIYALPNFFGEDPAVQISPKPRNGSAMATLNVDLITERLTAGKLNYLSMEVVGETLLVRFQNEELQMRARDFLRESLGNDYVVAFNSATRTPKWLRKIGASPVKLGLDFRGGVHFLLEVAVDDIIKQREENNLRQITGALKHAHIHYLALKKVALGNFEITFMGAEDLDRVIKLFNKQFEDYIVTKLPNGKKNCLSMQISEEALNRINDQVLEQALEVLTRRVNELGVSEAVIQRQGQRYLSIDLSGIQDTTQAKELIGKTASIRFQMMDVEHDPGSITDGVLPYGTKLYEYVGQKVLLKNQVVLSGEAISYAAASYADDGRPVVNIRLNRNGAARFQRVTAENIGQPMAVVYVENEVEERYEGGKVVRINHPHERVISIAMIQSALGTEFAINGLPDEKYAENLALLLRSGTLMTPVTIVQETTVSPRMGKTNVWKGILSIVVGYLLVMIFMVCYYHLFGVIADLALLGNLVLMVASLSGLGAALTLPGLAGMVLTVGLAVDACVLIYERIREELQSGATVEASIRHGYERAFTTIIDANMATLIVAILLFALGNSAAVKGFSVVLMIGIATSMMMSVGFTRLLVNWWFSGKKLKHLPIGL